MQWNDIREVLRVCFVNNYVYKNRKFYIYYKIGFIFRFEFCCFKYGLLV